MGEARLFDLTVFFYALSICFYFLDFVHRQRRLNRWGYRLLAVVWFLQLLVLLIRGLSKMGLPVFSLYDSLFFYAWLLVGVSLVINARYHLDFFLFFCNLLGFSLLTFSWLVRSQAGDSPLTDWLVSDMLLIHITLALLAYVAFSCSFVLSAMCLLQYDLLKRKVWNEWLRRLPSLEQLDRFAFQLNAIGFPLFLAAVILGIFWALLKLEHSIWLDPKVLTSLLVLALYGYALFLRLRGSGWNQRRFAWWNVLSFSTVILNLILSASVYSFHRWV